MYIIEWDIDFQFRIQNKLRSIAKMFLETDMHGQWDCFTLNIAPAFNTVGSPSYPDTYVKGHNVGCFYVVILKLILFCFDVTMFVLVHDLGPINGIIEGIVYVNY